MDVLTPVCPHRGFNGIWRKSTLPVKNKKIRVTWLSSLAKREDSVVSLSQVSSVFAVQWLQLQQLQGWSQSLASAEVSSTGVQASFLLPPTRRTVMDLTGASLLLTRARKAYCEQEVSMYLLCCSSNGYISRMQT